MHVQASRMTDTDVSTSQGVHIVVACVHCTKGERNRTTTNAELYTVHMPSLATRTCMLHTGGQHVCCNQGCARARAVRELCMDKLQCARHNCFCAAAQCAFILLSALTPFLRHLEHVTNNCMSTGYSLPAMWHTSTFIHTGSRS